MKASFGIDFGTTNSCAVMLPGGPNDRFGDATGRPLPSIIAIDKATGNAKPGRETWDHRFDYAARGDLHVVSSIKAQLEKDRNWFTPARKWAVVDVAAEVIRQLNQQVMRRGVRRGIERAVFGVPVDMSPKARRVLREAANLAGVEVSGIVKESTAVLMRHWEDVRHCRYVAVFDWGGGTLDISVIEIRGKSLFELSTRSLWEAGDYIDDRIARYVHSRVSRDLGLSISFENVSPSERGRLLVECERAKCMLAAVETVPIGLVEYCGARPTLDLTRSECSAVVSPVVQKAVELLKLSVREAGISPEELDQYHRVGGSSRLWLLPETLGSHNDYVGKCLFASQPEWDVAHGAALLQARPGEFFSTRPLGLSLVMGLTSISCHRAPCRRSNRTTCRLLWWRTQDKRISW